MEATDTSRHCPSCNTMMRPKALFCHHCGHAVALSQKEESEQTQGETDIQNEAAPAPETQNLSAESVNLNHKNNAVETEMIGILSPQTESDGHAQSETVVAPQDFRNSLDEKEQIQTIEPEAEPIAQPNTSTEQTLGQTENKSENTTAKPRRARTPRVVKTEYVWEESTADPTWRLLLFTVGAVIFVIIIFWLARFIR